MAGTPDPMSMLEVAEQSRQEAMARREAAVAHLATFALQALVEGHDVREIARRCGFMLDGDPEPVEENTEGFSMGGILFSGASYVYGGGDRRKSPEQHFATWLSTVVKERVEEAFKTGRPV
jgi:hypothetical protein